MMEKREGLVVKDSIQQPQKCVKNAEYTYTGAIKNG